MSSQQWKWNTRKCTEKYFKVTNRKGIINASLLLYWFFILRRHVQPVVASLNTSVAQLLGSEAPIPPVSTTGEP